MSKRFTKQDLKTGMMVQVRNGTRYVVMLDTPIKSVLVREHGYFLHLKNYRDDLTSHIRGTDDFEYDIVKIYKPRYASDMLIENWGKQILAWTRQEDPIEITIEEIAKMKGVDPSRIRIKD